MSTASDTRLAPDAPLPTDERLKLELRPEELIFRRLLRFASVAVPFGDTEGCVTHLATGTSSSHPDQTA